MALCIIDCRPWLIQVMQPILLIGEQPGRPEDKPFVEGAGQLLNKAGADFNKEQIYLNLKGI